MACGWLELSEHDRLAAIAELQADVDALAAEGQSGDGLANREFHLRRTHIVLLEQIGAAAAAVREGRVGRDQAVEAMAGEFGRGYLFGLLMTYKIGCMVLPPLADEEDLIVGLYARLMGPEHGERVYHLPVSPDPDENSEPFNFGVSCAVQDSHPLNGASQDGLLPGFRVWRLRDGLIRVVENAEAHEEKADWSLDEDHLRASRAGAGTGQGWQPSVKDPAADELAPWFEMSGDEFVELYRVVSRMAREAADPVEAGRHRAVEILLANLDGIHSAIEEGVLDPGAVRLALASEFGRGYLNRLVEEAGRVVVDPSADPMPETTMVHLCNMAFGSPHGLLIALQERIYRSESGAAEFAKGRDAAAADIAEHADAAASAAQAGAEPGTADVDGGDAFDDDEEPVPALVAGLMRLLYVGVDRVPAEEEVEPPGHWLKADLADLAECQLICRSVMTSGYPSPQAARHMGHMLGLRQLVGLRQAIQQNRIAAGRAQKHLEGDIGHGYLLGLLAMMEFFAWEEVADDDKLAVVRWFYTCISGSDPGPEVDGRFRAVLQRGGGSVDDTVGKASALACQDVLALCEDPQDFPWSEADGLATAMLANGAPGLFGRLGPAIGRLFSKNPAAGQRSVAEWQAWATANRDRNPFE